MKNLLTKLIKNAMKTNFKLLFLGIILLLASCKQHNDMLTRINADGSCYREFNENANQAFLKGSKLAKDNPFPVDLDSSWQLSWTCNNAKFRADFPLSKAVYDSIFSQKKGNPKIVDKKPNADVIITARRNYKSVEEMDKLFRLKKSEKWSDLKVKHKLETQFRWFYTYYTYTETYPNIKNNLEIPIGKYMTKDEAMYWFTGQPNVLQGMNGVEAREYVGKIEDGFNLWFAQNMWNAEFKVLVENYDKLKNPPVSTLRLIQLRDSIFNKSSKNFMDIKMEQALNEYFKTKVFSVLWKVENNPMKKFEEAYLEHTIGYFETEFNYKLILPGKVTQPGNAIINGDTLTWKLTAYRFIPADYVIQAQSRKVNVWAFLLTGLIILIAVGSFIRKPKR